MILNYTTQVIVSGEHSTQRSLQKYRLIFHEKLEQGNETYT